MSKGSLKSRDRGFAPFEAYLFNKPHLGWIRWISRDMFALKKSPFTDIQTPHSYKVPQDLGYWPDDSFVEVEVNRNLIKNRIIGSKIIRYYDVLNINKISPTDLESPKPYLYSKKESLFSYFDIKDEFQDKNEFINRIASYWKNADADKLDWALAIQLLSCPRSLYGVGGIGAESTSLAGTRKTPLKDIKRCVNHLLPIDFKNKNNNLRYHFIEDKSTCLNVRDERAGNAISEVSYNYLYHFPEKDVPVQLPIFIENAEYTNKLTEPDPDVRDFILTALIISPPIENNLIKELENSMRRVHEKLQLNMEFQQSIDLYSPVKIALALCRMELKEKLDADMLSKSLSQFEELYEKYVDAKEYLLKVNQERETRVRPRPGGPPNEHILSQEIRINKIIIDISEELGVEWVPISNVKEHKRFNPKWETSLMYSLQLLNNNGLILMRKNYTELRQIKL